jgi:hypothetical protein
MTVQELIRVTENHQAILVSIFLALPLLAWLAGLIHGKGSGASAPWKYFYSVFIYLACIPGMFASVLTAYAMFFQNENLLTLNLLIYFLPIVAMVVTLIFVRKNVDFASVPGFDRLAGLMIMIACSFGLALAIQKTKIWIFFGGSIERLFILAAGIFALLKWGAYMVFRRKDEPIKQRPQFPVS